MTTTRSTRSSQSGRSKASAPNDFHSKQVLLCWKWPEVATRTWQVPVSVGVVNMTRVWVKKRKAPSLAKGLMPAKCLARCWIKCVRCRQPATKRARRSERKRVQILTLTSPQRSPKRRKKIRLDPIISLRIVRPEKQSCPGKNTGAARQKGSRQVDEAV